MNIGVVRRRGVLRWGEGWRGRREEGKGKRGVEGVGRDGGGTRYKVRLNSIGKPHQGQLAGNIGPPLARYKTSDMS